MSKQYVPVSGMLLGATVGVLLGKCANDAEWLSVAMLSVGAIHQAVLWYMTMGENA